MVLSSESIAIRSSVFTSDCVEVRGGEGEGVSESEGVDESESEDIEKRFSPYPHLPAYSLTHPHPPTSTPSRNC